MILFINTSFCILGEVGFLAEDRRINVAVTRARRHIAVVCDTQTVQNHAFLKSLISHMTEFGEVRTAFEYLQDVVPQNYSREQEGIKKPTSSSTKQKVKDQPVSKAKQKNTSVEITAALQKHTKTCTSSAPREEQHNGSRYAEIREQVEDFIKDLNRNDLQFPPSFNSHDRLLVHQISEELGLVHESRGEGSDRCVTVSRPVTSQPAEEPTREGIQEEETASSPQSEPSCRPSLDLKSLHLERMRREQQRREEAARQQKGAPPAQSQLTKKVKGS